MRLIKTALAAVFIILGFIATTPQDASAAGENYAFNSEATRIVGRSGVYAATRSFVYRNDLSAFGFRIYDHFYYTYVEGSKSACLLRINMAAPSDSFFLSTGPGSYHGALQLLEDPFDRSTNLGTSPPVNTSIPRGCEPFNGINLGVITVAGPEGLVPPSLNNKQTVDPRDLGHVHFRVIDSTGKDVTSIMSDGSVADRGIVGVGDEIDFVSQDDGEYGLARLVCQIRSSSPDLNRYIFHPTYGPVSDSIRNPKGYLYPNTQDCDNWESRNSEEDYLGDNKSQLSIITLHAFPYLVAGESYGVYTYGELGNETIPIKGSDVVDPFDKFEKTLGITIDDDAGGYTYSGTSKNGRGTVSKHFEIKNPCNNTHVQCGDHEDFIYYIHGTQRGGIIGIIEAVLGWVIEKTKEMIEALTRLVKNIITIPHSYFTGAGGNDGVIKAWEVARGLSNTLFVLVLIVLAMANILRFQIEKYDIRATIPRLIVSVILVNFSLLIVGVLVDLTNVATIAIQSRFDAIAQTDTTQAITLANDAAAGALAILLIIVLFVLLLIVVLWLVILLAFRVAVIFAMTALAPIAFMFFALPATAGLLQTWWKNLIRFLIMGPVIMFLLAMSGTIITSVQKDADEDIAILLSFFVAIGFVAIAGLVPVMLGGKAFAAAGGYAKRLGALAGRRAAGTRPARALAGAMQTLPGLRHIPGVKAVGTRLGAVAAGVGAVSQERMERAASVMNTTMLKRRFKSTRSGNEKFAAGKVLDARSALEPEDYTEFIDGAGAKTNEAIGIAIKASQEKDPRIAGAIGKAGGKIGEPGSAWNRATRKAISELPSHFKDTGERVSRTSGGQMASYKAEVLRTPEARTNFRLTDARQLTNWSPAHLKQALAVNTKDDGSGSPLAKFEKQTQKLIEQAAKKAGL